MIQNQINKLPPPILATGKCIGIWFNICSSFWLLGIHLDWCVVMIVNRSIVRQSGYQLLMKNTTCSMVWFSIQGIIHLTYNITWFSEHINQSPSGSIGSIETVNKSRHPFNYFMIIFLVINYRDIGIILLLQLLIGIPINIKYWKYIPIIHSSVIHCPTDRSLVLGSFNCHNKPRKRNQLDVSTRYVWFSSDTCFCIIFYGRDFLLAGNCKKSNDFIVEISKGDKVGDIFIVNKNYSCIRAEIDLVFVIEPGPEGIISIRSYGSIRQ